MMPAPVKAWSHSRLTDFEKCKHITFLKVVKKIPEPPRPLPPGKTEHANDRGSRVHEAAEAFVRGGVELISELEKFKAEFEQLRFLYGEGKVSLEGEWAFTRDWKQVSWFSHDVWCRVKCDAVITIEPEHMVVVDYKTGKRQWNEVKHGEQMELYAIGTFVRNPDAKRVTVELWYTDLNKTHREVYSRDRALGMVAKWERRGEALTTEADFPPNPSTFNCKWCPYKPIEKGGTGHCPVGV